MKKIVNIIIAIFIGVVITQLISCRNQTKSKVEEVLNNYLIGLSPFNTELKSHFPLEFSLNEIKEMSFILPNTVVNGGASIALLRIKPDTSKFNKLFKEAKGEYELIKNLGEENLIMLPDSSDKSEIENPIFIPKLDSVLDDESGIDTKYKENFNFFVIDSKPGVFVTNADELKDKPYLPKGWHHGYSRGIGFDLPNMIVIYWLVIW